MQRIQPRSLFLTAVVLLLATTTFQRPLHSQTDSARVSLSLTQLSPALPEVWPADINEDGITDLVEGSVVIQIGHGDGTFEPAQTIATNFGTVVGVGDINRDGFIDILTARPGPPTISFALPGHGDGTFGVPIMVPALAAPTYVVDMDNDGAPDLVFPGVLFVAVYQGHGDFTFGTVTQLGIGSLPSTGLTIADFNGDGLLDVAFTTLTATVDVFLNIGAFSFSGTSIIDLPPPLSAGGLTARDMNGDGVVDLVAGFGEGGNPFWRSGFIELFLGNGDGRFQAPAGYPVNNGPVAVVAGDFNGDGIQDVATGNRSTQDRCGNVQNYWDSVSILLGRGDGTLAPTQSFALGDSEVAPDIVYRRSLSRLNTSDLNADGRTDLLVSPGAILLMQPAGENHAPVANAGPDVQAVVDQFDSTLLQGSATDADADWLTFEWRDDLGNVLGDLPRQCVLPSSSGTRIYTLTVNDGHGGVSSDSMQFTFLPATGGGPLPGGVSSTTIGDASAAAAFYTNSTQSFTVAASGADIWGTADAFNFVYAPMRGDFDVSVRVNSLENIDPWTKAGLMIRQSLAADSRHASIFATPTAVNGTAFQRRLVDGGDSTHTAGASLAPPVWLRLVRQGDTITAFTGASRNDEWTLVGTDTLPNLSAPVYVGLAVTSHSPDHPATATFDNYDIVALNGPPSTVPPGWKHQDVGDVGAAGASTGANNIFTVQGSGADIWGTADAFQYAFTRLAADGGVVVHVADVAGPHQWSKAGLMIRQSLDPSARQHFLLVSESRGIAYQRRLNPGEESLNTNLTTDSMPAWFRIERTGNLLHLWYSVEPGTPTTWQPVGDAVFPNGEALIGLAVTSHVYGELATGTFDHVTVTYGSLLPTWNGRDIGAVGIPGADVFDGSRYTIAASGADVWDTVDAFHYVYRSLEVNGSIVARVAALDAPNPWTKAGVMIRTSIDPSSAHAFMLVSRDNGIAFQRRPTLGADSVHTSGGSGVAPLWVRLTRTENVVTGAYSSDGVNWVDVGTDVISLGDGPALVGLAVTSHDNSALATATFDNVSLTP